MTGTGCIRWDAGAEKWATAWFGCVGTVGPHLFSILRPMAPGDRWALTSYLPGQLGKVSRADDPDDLKAEAEEWLEGFVSSLGAVFPGGDDEGGEPIEVRFAAGRRVRYQYPDAGYPGEAEDAARHLTPGGVYTIAWADIGQSRTDLNLAADGKPVGRFNSVFFEIADDQEAAVTAGED